MTCSNTLTRVLTTRRTGNAVVESMQVVADHVLYVETVSDHARGAFVFMPRPFVIHAARFSDDLVAALQEIADAYPDGTADGAVPGSVDAPVCPDILDLTPIPRSAMHRLAEAITGEVAAEEPDDDDRS